MKKRAVAALGVVTAMLLTGCTKVGAKDDIIVVSDVKMSESKEEKVIEETVQEVPMAESIEMIECETESVEELCDITAYEENANLLHRVYEGTIGETPVRFMFYIEENELKEARYIFQGDVTEYHMTGEFDFAHNSFHLVSEDESQMVVGELYNYDDNGDRLIGTHLKDSIAKEFMVQRVWNVGNSESMDEIYDFLGFQTDSVNRFVDEFIGYLKNDDVDAVEQMLQYPVRVAYAYQDDIILECKEDFKTNYNVIFDDEHKDSLINDFQRYFYGYDDKVAAFSERIDIVQDENGELKINDIRDHKFTVVNLGAPEKG